MEIKLPHKIAFKILQFFIQRGAKESTNDAMCNFYVDNQNVSLSVGAGDDVSFIHIEPKVIPEILIAIDFDGTICEVAYPEVGAEREGATEYINKLYDMGYGIVINTCRTLHAATNAINFMKERGIKYHYFNTNFPHLTEQYGNDCRKISADVYVEDRCLFEIPSWKDKFDIITARFPNAERNGTCKITGKVLEEDG